MRLFVAVDPDEAVRAALGAAIDALRPLAPDARWARPEGLHLTLAFLGEIPDAIVPEVRRAVEVAAGASAPLRLRAGGGGSFGSRAHPRVLWVGLEGDVEALASLKSSLEAALAPAGYAPDPRPFAPHLTLARSRPPRGDRDLALCAADPALADLGAFTVSELVLYRSHLSPQGSRYEAVLRAKLGGG
ncbi:MAG TPA: RNA 2',3'-cyclic phosphodiesterase [Vulgatibacter sp.]|nr:RNA 2',3'-cyclic phosphodiesterase [Vulgatibacter sp.]